MDFFPLKLFSLVVYFWSEQQPPEGKSPPCWAGEIAPGAAIPYPNPLKSMRVFPSIAVIFGLGPRVLLVLKKPQQNQQDVLYKLRNKVLKTKKSPWHLYTLGFAVTCHLDVKWSFLFIISLFFKCPCYEQTTATEGM